jgi:hypothetical protein
MTRPRHEEVFRTRRALAKSLNLLRREAMRKDLSDELYDELDEDVNETRRLLSLAKRGAL